MIALKLTAKAGGLLWVQIAINVPFNQRLNLLTRSCSNYQFNWVDKATALANRLVVIWLNLVEFDGSYNIVLRNIQGLKCCLLCNFGRYFIFPQVICILYRRTWLSTVRRLIIPLARPWLSIWLPQCFAVISCWHRQWLPPSIRGSVCRFVLMPGSSFFYKTAVVLRLGGTGIISVTNMAN